MEGEEVKETKTHWVGWVFFFCIFSIGYLIDGTRGIICIWLGVLMEIIYLSVKEVWDAREKNQ